MTSAPASTTAGLTPEQLLARRDQNHDTEIYTCAVVFSALSIGSVAMRVTSRHMKNVAVGIDDVLVIISMVNCAWLVYQSMVYYKTGIWLTDLPVKKGTSLSSINFHLHG